MPPVTSPGAPFDLTLQRPQLARVRFRRALVLLAMTLLLPGSAQLVAGRKDIGRLALRIWLGLVAVVALVLTISWFWHGFAFRLGASTFALGVVRLVLTGVAIGWALLFIDAWRLGRPLELERRQRLAVVGLNGVLCFGVAGALLFTSHVVGVQRNFITAVFGDGIASASEHGRYNVLLIGGDAGSDRWGLRTDSLTVASIDEETGKTVLFGLPRNMTNFPFPEGSVLHEQFPAGYDCEGCALNSLATWAADNRELFAGSAAPGVDATIQGVEGITGLKINYYALVNMEGFRSLVTAMGGLTLNVRDRIPIGLPITDYIEPGVRRLNGFETLWFVRSRESADDYSRMARQKCVLNAMLQQLSPQTVLTKFEGLAAAGQDLVQTNLPASELAEFAELALKAREHSLATVSFVPPTINTADPDIDKIRTMIADAIEKSEVTGEPASKRPKRAGGKGFTTKQGQPTTGGSVGSLSSGYAANQSQNLSRVC